MPSRLVRPIVERMPTRLVCDDGPADGVAGVGPEADGAEARGDRRGRAAARAGRDAIERVGIARVAGQQRVHRLHRIEGELRHVALRQHDGARFPELLDLKGVGLRHHALQRQRPRRGRHVRRLVVVLHDQRHAVQRAGGTRLREPGVERVGDLQRVGVGDDDRVQGRALPVVRLDAVEVHLDQPATRQRPRLERRMDVGDRRFLVAEEIEGARVDRRGEQKTDQRSHPQSPTNRHVAASSSRGSSVLGNLAARPPWSRRWMYFLMGRHQRPPRPRALPRAPVPRSSRPQPRTPPPAGAAGTARPRASRSRLLSREPQAARKIGAPCGAPVVPPSTTISVPVTFDASSDAR